jgi:hypothetical protein
MTQLLPACSSSTRCDRLDLAGSGQAVHLLVVVDEHADHLVGDDEVAAVPTGPHAGGFEFGRGDRGLGPDRVEVVVADEPGVPVVDAVDDPVAVQLDRGGAQRRHAVELDERAGVISVLGHQRIVGRPPQTGAPPTHNAKNCAPKTASRARRLGDVALVAVRLHLQAGIARTSGRGPFASRDDRSCLRNAAR